MKTIKYLIAGLLTMVLSAPVMAQDVDYQTALKPVQEALEKKAPEAAELAKKYKKTYKKDAKAMVALGHAYLGVSYDKDGKIVNPEYLNEAKAIGDELTNNKRFANSGDAWILLGDVAVAEAQDGDAGPAAAYYETAISVDPKNKLAYERYATVNRNAAPEEAIKKLQEYKQIDPSYQVEAKIADLYYNQRLLGKANEWYAKGDANNYSETDFTKWSYSEFFSKSYAEALKVAQQGLGKFPKNVDLKRAALYAAVEMEKFDDAVNYAKDLLATTKSPTAMDYSYYGSALLGVKDYQNAITELQKALEMDSKDLTPMGKISQAYMGLGDEDKALEYSQQYLEKAMTVSYTDYSNLADIYTKKGDAAKGDVQKDFYNKAMGVWEIMANKVPSLADIAYYMESQIAQNQLKDEAKVRELNQKIIKADEGKSELSSNSKLILTAAYLNEAIYYNNNNQMDQAKALAEKVIAIDPENATAKQILSVGQPAEGTEAPAE